MPGKSKKKEDEKAQKPKEDPSEQTQSKDIVGQQQSEGGEKSTEEQKSGEEQEKPQGKEEEQSSKEEQQPEATEDSTGDTQGDAKDEAPKNPAVDGLYQLVGRPEFFGRNKDPKYHFVKHDETMGKRYRISLNEGPDTLHLSEDEMSYISAPMLEYDYHIVLHANGKYFIHRPAISD